MYFIFLFTHLIKLFHLSFTAINPLATILNPNKLNGDNYVDWKRNLHIVLTAEKIGYVLTDPYHNAPLEDASDEDKKAYEAWKAHDEYAKCIILASMENVCNSNMLE